MNNIRNFVIFSHIDHGKSTLADRFLEITKTIPSDKMRSRFLDMMDLEREKGITIKMQPVRMNWTIDGKQYMLNLIDTPGHVDFNYEVSRSLAAVEGGILLVDATKGIQAQTLANLDLAQKQNVVIISAANKIDLAHAQVEETKQDISNLLNISQNEIFAISGKTGTNVESLLKATVLKIPAPEGDEDKPLRALVFDSKYDSYKGVIAYVRLFDGKVKAGDKIYLVQTKIQTQVKEVGYFSPELKVCDELRAGEIGYIATGVKETASVRVGETITTTTTKEISAFPGYKEPKSMVFASIYPENPNDFEVLSDAFKKLKLNDASFVFEKERKEFLGRGFRCGFLGSLHAEIICERLKREFSLDLIISTPSVVYKIIDKKNNEKFIYSASDWPDRSTINETQEPWVMLEVITPVNYLGVVSDLLKESKAIQIENKYLSNERLILIYEIPLRKIIVGFFDKLKGISQGFASMNYEVLGYRPANLIKLDVLIAGKKESVFSRVVEQSDAHSEGKKIVSKLKEILPAQLFSVPVQAVISGKIIARETIKARRRDVTAPLYGGDVTRKRKLLERQKKGKKKLKARGQVSIPSKVFLEMFKQG
ncbi:MAG: translation elongation factor 4 [Patescibacteria group bacterium]|nr:translation elongation factor 4 [Patescibacteria group bacterium]